jgi:hypothetical protein
LDGHTLNFALSNAFHERFSEKAHHARLLGARCRQPRLAVYGDPDLVRCLRGQRVSAQRRQQTDRALRHALGRLGEAVMLGVFVIGQSVHAAAALFE